MTQPDWWRTAVVYEIYPRSFRDADGDGVGDLEGVRQGLPHLERLGVDAIWFTPWYVSPLADGGYDVQDYRRIDPVFGTLEQAEALISQARERGIRTIIDVVPNHVSDRHPWFVEALASPPGSDARRRFWFHPGKGPDGSEPPTHWKNNFGGDVWTRTTKPDGSPGEWYLHLFAAEQPDLNWTHPDVVREHEDILRFWFDRGVAGIRIDSAAHIMKDPALPEDDGTHALGAHPNLDRDEVHEIYRRWRAVADSYDEPRMLVGEVWLPDAGRFARYLAPDEMHTAFNFDLMTRAWDAGELRESIDLMLAAHEPVAAPCTWVLSNHDVTRPVTRYGRADSSFDFDTKAWGVPTDEVLGLRRARAAALLVAALPGSLYVYQGDELGLPEVEDLDRAELQDPMYVRTGGTSPGRDGCRVPLPWSGDRRPFGFSPEPGTKTWLTQPAGWAGLSVEAQDGDPSSTLTLYRESLLLRRAEAELRTAAMSWLDLGPSVLAFRRGDIASVTNLGSDAVALDPAWSVLLGSEPLVDGALPADATVWVRLVSP
ncbi:alpha-glucosidase [Aeromicrobium sp. Root236]|uniref:glycoside hydrolase family 13 protein n=1 Tax=Aeromicrobium sp. Root236 TaxID=1736498 RepID=UPI0006FE3C65|nr:alpha-amylase family glycosyl hydrolase [Aeromicrobium sp. Root236]KRC65980.1 alpha-glucosidase [Aeromicrobium sp. Root236]